MNASSPETLPPPSAPARAHCERVCRAVARAISASDDGAWLPFDRFMDLALHAPGLGYYAAGASKFGEAGDFVTAPEITPLFGFTLARWASAVAARVADPADWTLVEYGGGTGALAQSMLDALAQTAHPPTRYLLIEPSGDLRERQRERLHGCALIDRVQWEDGPPSAPLAGVIVANEVLDALAVSRFRIAPGGVQELGVEHAEGPILLRLSWRPASDAVMASVRALEHRLGCTLPEGYVSELCPRRDAWIASITPSLAQGAALFIDYGLSEREYYAPARDDGTLMCYYRHRAHGELLHLPGLQDLTAWVDFSAVARQGQALGLELRGYTTQAGFLLGNGFDALASDALVPTVDERERVRTAAACRQLLLPGAMGERFRVMALARELGSDPLPGFAQPDLRRTL